jgi:hypothetical protein
MALRAESAPFVPVSARDSSRLEAPVIQLEPAPALDAGGEAEEEELEQGDCRRALLVIDGDFLSGNLLPGEEYLLQALETLIVALNSREELSGGRADLYYLVTESLLRPSTRRWLFEKGFNVISMPLKPARYNSADGDVDEKVSVRVTAGLEANLARVLMDKAGSRGWQTGTLLCADYEEFLYPLSRLVERGLAVVLADFMVSDGRRAEYATHHMTLQPMGNQECAVKVRGPAGEGMDQRGPRDGYAPGRSSGLWGVPQSWSPPSPRSLLRLRCW